MKVTTPQRNSEAPTQDWNEAACVWKQESLILGAEIVTGPYKKVLK